jgi:hypothetical protein
VASLQLSLSNIVSGFLHHFQLSISYAVTLLLLVMLQEFFLEYGQNEGQVRVIRTSSPLMRLA